ncbi:MAG: 50S ribosomal protein L18 [Bradymonadaceae bacterium]
MLSKRERKNNRLRRKRSIRKDVTGTPERPRLSVYRSNKHIYAQVIDDYAAHTLASASTLDDEVEERLEELDDGATRSDEARIVGEVIGERALDEGVDKIVFDRNGFVYHGRVEAVADGAREAGLDF